MAARSAALAALLLLAPAFAAGGDRTARLVVTANVVRSVQVSVAGGGAGALLRVRTQDATWSASLEAAAGEPGVLLAPSAKDPRYLVVTVLADAAPRGAAR